MALRAELRIFAAGLSLLCLGAATPAAPSFVPVLKENFPDAFVLLNGGRFVAYSTNDGPNVPVATSSDLVHWSFVKNADGKRRDAMPRLAPWVKPGFTWAPEVLQLGNRFLLYYTANHRQKDLQCIGVAVASDPLGPFVDDSPTPLVCQFKLGGSIDASPFRDKDGKLYLYFKSDGNRVHERTWLWGQPLGADGRSVTGQPAQLLGDNGAWKERVIEAPTMVRSPAGYKLFYSGGFFGWNDDERGLSPYGMGYASCTGPLGPCTEAPGNPLLHSFKEREAGCLSGPGHQSLFAVGARTFISFHAWAATARCTKLEDERYLYIAPIFWKDGKPLLGPSMRPQ